MRGHEDSHVNRLPPLPIELLNLTRVALAVALALAAVATGRPLLPQDGPGDGRAQAAAQSPLPGGWESVANGDRVRRLLAEGDVLWAATEAGGVVRWSLEAGTYIQYLAPQHGLLSNEVYDLARTADGVLWVATARGLSALDEDLDRFETLVPATSPGMPARMVTALEPTADGKLWVGFHQEYDLEAVDPASRLPGSFLRGGLARYDPAGAVWEQEFHAELKSDWRRPEFKTLPSENVVALATGTDGILWIGTEPYFVWEPNQCTGSDCPPEAGYWVRAGGGLAATKDGAWQYWSSGENEAGNCYKNSIRDLVPDVDGRMWVAATDGLMVMRHGMQRVGCEAQTRYGKSVRGGPGLRGRATWSVALDGDGRVWAGTGEGRTKGLGVSILDHNNTLDDWSSWEPDDYWEHVDLFGIPGDSEEVVTAIVVLGPDRVVMGTQSVRRGDGEGIAVYNPLTNRWRSLRTADDGLPSNQVTDVRANPVTGDLWVSMRNRGVARYDGEHWQSWRMFAAGEQVATTTVVANRGIQNIPTDLVDRAAFDRAFPATPRYARIGEDPTLYRVTNYTAASQSIRVLPALRMDVPVGTRVYAIDRGPASDAATRLAFDAQGNTWVGGRETVWVDKCAQWPHCWLDGGLGKYDGRHWTVYDLSPAETGLTSRDQEVQAVEVDLRGRVWAGTGNPSEGLDGKGIFVLDPAAGTWSLYDTKGIRARFFGGDGIADLALDPVTGHMWVAHHSVEVCDQSSPFGGACSPSFTGGGVSLFNGTDWEKWTKRTGAPLKAAGQDGELSVIALDRVNDRVFVGGFDTEPRNFHWGEGRGYHATLNWCPLVGCANATWQSKVWPQEGMVAAVDIDHEGRVWVGTHRWGNGIAPPTGGIRLLQGEAWHSLTQENTGLPSNEVTVLRRVGEDMWVGTLADGLVHYSRTVRPTPTPRATSTPRPTLTPTRVTTSEPTPTVPGGTNATGTAPAGRTPGPGCGADGPCRLYLPLTTQRSKCYPNCPTWTPTVTPRLSATPVSPAAASATRTVSPIGTAAATATHTPGLATATATATATAAATDTPGPSATPSVTPTPSATPTVTPTPSPTASTTPERPAIGTWRVYEGTVPRDAFYSIHGTDAAHVWFVGARSQILYWDGGKMFQQPDGVPSDRVLRKVWAQSASRVFVVGDGSTFLETRNGGQLWRRAGSDVYQDDWRAVTVIRTDDGLRGWALGNLNGNRLYFDGTTWGPQSPADRNNRTHKYVDVAMLGAGSAVAVQGNTTGARIYTWDGTNWGAGPSTGALWDMHALSPTAGVAVGARGATWRLNASGQWQRMESEPRTGGNDLFGVHMVAPDRIWAVGARGGIYLWDGASWTSHAVPGQVRSINAIWLSEDGAEGWAVGDGGLFLRYE